MRSGSLFWGVVLVLIGAILLAQNFGLIPVNVNIWAVFWSLVLVALGVGLLLRSLRPRTGLREEAFRQPLEGASQATVRFHHGAGELVIDGKAAADELLSGTFGGGVEPRVEKGDGIITLDLRTPSDMITDLATFSTGGLNWTIGLNPNIPLKLEFEVGASQSILNLRDLQVKELHLQTGASKTELDFPEHAGETRAWVKTGAASFEACVPEGVAARVRTRGGMASIEVDTLRFPQSASGEYVSPDYETAANRLELDVEVGVGAVRIR